MNVLITGAAGYIGSHAVLRLLEDGHRVIAVDDLSRGHRQAIEVLAGAGDLTFHEGDLGDRAAVTRLLRDHSVELVMHFGAKAYVGESVDEPLVYYRNNTGAAIELLAAMDAAGVRRFVFSSTCATYGEPDAARIPIREDCPQEPINPYGRSKLMVEKVLRDYAASCPDFAFVALRYFNVAGSDPAGRIGEVHDPETHLVPICLQAALGLRDGVTIFGDDYATVDGTCVRDYVHVSDLIDAHVLAMSALEPGERRAWNVGIGRGYSVREVIESTKRVTGIDYPVRQGPRRPGDPPALFADSARIRAELGWEARFTDLDEIVATAWEWFREHPRGY